MGYSVAANEVNSDGGISVPTAPGPAGDEVTLDGGTAAGVSPITVPTQGSSIGAAPSAPAHTAGVEQQRAASGGSTPVASTPPTFRDVEIGGGRITGHEVSADGQSDREFAMYSAEQYMPPTGPYDTVQTVDGASWYRQYAQPVVEKTPYQGADDKIKYEERIVSQMPPVPKRKDKI